MRCEDFLKDVSMRLAALTFCLALPAFQLLAAAMPIPAPAGTDPFLWLEDVHGDRAMDWVKQQDARSLGVLEKDPHYQRFFDAALAINQARDRIPEPAQIGGKIYNFWQDADHVRGIWRRTPIEAYRQAAPAWDTVLDVDALSKAEKANWVYKGANCLEPEERRCLISLSDGGEDAVVEREFDLTAPGFLKGGFSLPRAKMSADWEDRDTLLVATDWGPGSMTASGYPFIVKRLERGAQLAHAQEVFRGKPSDVQVAVQSLTDGQGDHVELVQEGLDFFHSAYFQIQEESQHRLSLPEKSEIIGLLDNRLIVKLDEAWRPKNAPAIPAGSIAALDMATQDAPPQSLFVPNARQSVDEVAVTRDHVVAAIYDNVRGRAYAFTPTKKGWVAARVDLPENSAIELVSTSLRDNNVFYNVSGFLAPSSLWLGDLDGAAPALIKQSPPRFDASRDMVDQYEASSTDGTKIPYFVVHPKTMKLDGENPTLLYAYGGFQVSMVPSYSGVTGKLWLEQGNVYVLANIRGGGEFGPAWHEAALKTKRQTAYDDFAAVAQDLIARKITSPRRLGIEGGSNGGLLMGVEFEQHPALWNATVIEVPLLDMLRFEQIAAGASWVGEYGSVANPEEKAFLEKISPYANLKAGVKYPEPFIYTTTKDDRVGPQHARKFAAKMAAMGLPFLYYEAIEGGHGAGVNAREKSEEKALEITYLTRKLVQ
jgi:prolyl oligopeptidase